MYLAHHELESVIVIVVIVYLVPQSLEPFYDQFDPDFINIRKTVREVLQKEDDLNEIVQLVGKVSWPNLHAYHLHHRLHAVCTAQLVDKFFTSQLHAYHLHRCLHTVCIVQLVGTVSRSNPTGGQGQ